MQQEAPSAGVRPRPPAVSAWQHLLACAFRIDLAAGQDDGQQPVVVVGRALGLLDGILRNDARHGQDRALLGLHHGLVRRRPNAAFQCAAANCAGVMLLHARPGRPAEAAQQLGRDNASCCPARPSARPSRWQPRRPRPRAGTPAALTSRVARCMVRHIFVPVSPSGTGKTFSASTASRCLFRAAPRPRPPCPAAAPRRSFCAWIKGQFLPILLSAPAPCNCCRAAFLPYTRMPSTEMLTLADLSRPSCFPACSARSRTMVLQTSAMEIPYSTMIKRSTSSMSSTRRSCTPLGQVFPSQPLHQPVLGAF